MDDAEAEKLLVSTAATFDRIGDALQRAAVALEELVLLQSRKTEWGPEPFFEPSPDEVYRRAVAGAPLNDED